MLRRQHRLLPRTPFPHARIVRSPYFILKLVANDVRQSRFGFIVSKKVSKSAVSRNTTKRILRNCIEENLEKIKQGYDMLFIATRVINRKDHGAACQQMNVSLLRAEVMQ